MEATGAVPASGRGERVTRPSRHAPGRTGVFATICAFSFLVNFARVAFAPLVDHFISTGVTPAVAGLAATAVWLGSGLLRLPTGYLLTVVRRHQAILGMGLLLAIAATFTALAPDINAVVLGALFVGLSTGIFFVAVNPLVSELYPERVGRVLGLRGMFSQIAAVSAPFLVAVAIGAGSWRYAFFAHAGVVVVTTLVFGLAVDRADLPNAGAEDREFLGAIRSQWRLITAGVVFVGCAAFAWQGIFNFYVTYLGAAKGVDSGLANTLLTVTFAAGIPSFYFAGWLADRFPHRALLIAALTGFATCIALLTVATSLVSIVAVSVAMSLVVHALFPIGDTYLLDTLPDESRASAYAGFSATMMLMQSPGSVTVGVLSQSGFSYTAIFRGFAVAVAGITLAMAVLTRSGRIPR
jgi:MFS family permease